MKILLLGVGMQGKAALHDLLCPNRGIEVIAADRDLGMLRSHVANSRYGGNVRCEPVDAQDQETIDRLLRLRPDVVIDLLPVHFSPVIAEAAVRNRIHLVNTVYPQPDVLNLAEEAKSRGVTILPEFGMDPGIDLVLLGEAVRSLDRVEEIFSYGAGIPEKKAAKNAIQYKQTWNFEGVLRAYRRPGQVIRNHRVVTIEDTEVFSPKNIHSVTIAGLGKLEAYPNGDALKYADQLGIERTTLKNMGRFALRWPGHCEFWKKMVDLHLLDIEPVTVGDQAISPRRFLAAVISPQIQLGPQERDVVIVRVDVRGRKNKKSARTVFQLIDRRDLKTGFTAMSRTVGFTASIGAQLIANGQIDQRGLLSPLKDISIELLARELKKRSIRITTRHIISK